MAQHTLWSCGCTWRTVKGLKNSLLATYFRWGCLQFSESIFGQNNFRASDWTAEKPQHGSKQINKRNLDASGLYASGGSS